MLSMGLLSKISKNIHTVVISNEIIILIINSYANSLLKEIGNKISLNTAVGPPLQ